MNRVAIAGTHAAKSSRRGHDVVLGIMQPYFFPYLGHFALIAHTNAWAVFDISQYTPKTWMNRNRVLHPKDGWSYVTAPLSNSSINIKTHEARILDLPATQNTVLGKLSHYRRKAPYFNEVAKLVNQAFDGLKSDSLVSLNVQALRVFCGYLGIPFHASICSELHLPLPPNLGPGEWALEISSLLGATGYMNPISGKDLFDPLRFKDRNVSLYFLQFEDFVYGTGTYQFERNLSILDVLMWNHPKVVLEYVLRNSRFIAA